MLPMNKAASRRISRENLLEAKDMTTGQPPTSCRDRGKMSARRKGTARRDVGDVRKAFPRYLGPRRQSGRSKR